MRIKNNRGFIFGFLGFLVFLPVAQAADIPGSKDPAGIKRYEGTEIVRYEQIAYDGYLVPLAKMTNFDFGTKIAEFEKSEKLEGGVTRVSYRLPDPQRSSLEVFRNYQTSLTESGWEVVYAASGKQEFGNAFAHVYESLRDNDQLFPYNDAQGHLLVAKKSSDGLTAVLFVTKYEYGLTRNVKVEKGDPILQLDVIQTKAMDQKMVVVSSTEMAQSIEKTGRISLYGILFDFNKADIKPESEPTLEQVAELFSGNPSLKLLIVGHTDNQGDFEFNRKLSQQRADAVVALLASKHHIDRSQLFSFGASFASPVAANDSEEGRAKNRRVELVPTN